MAILLSFPLQIGTRGQYFDLPRTPARATPAGMPPFGLRRQTGSQERENQSSELSSVAAPEPHPQTTMSTRAITERPSHFGFWILRLNSGQVLDFRFITQHSNFKTKNSLFNHLIRSCQHIRRNREADLLRRFP